MAGISIRRSGYTHVGELMLAVVADLTDNGFSVINPVPWVPPVDATGRAKFKVMLEAGIAVDPLNNPALPAKQPWRVQIEVFDKHTAGMVLGSNQSLRTDGSLSWTTTGTTTKVLAGPIGVVGGRYTKGTTPADKAPDPTKPEDGFINRTSRVVVGSADISDSAPMTYYLCIAERGFVLCVWEDFTSDLGAKSVSWVVAQRPVDRVSGAVVITGKAPVFAMFSTAEKIQRFTVRESDVMRPSDAVDAGIDTEYNNAIINIAEQVAISEGNRYVVSFPSRLNTTRYAYTYELDMLGYTSGDVVSENTDVPLKVYNEADPPRNYVSLLANGPNNTGMRIVALKSGGGITAP
jgi:hypothetical protein